jgi:hypothetical protein
MQEEWREILEFPGYSVSNTGLVRNEDFGKDHEIRMMTQHVNQRGIANVSFNRRGRQYKRSVAVLVAKAFITTARSLAFDTPINLDGDRLNNCVDNLAWRPRWHATEYFQQFRQPRQSIEHDVQEYKTEEVFESSWEAALRFGLLDFDIVQAIANATYARPTFQRFRIYKR